MTMQIGWIGVGKMGAPMATHILNAGHRLSVYDRTPEQCRELKENGATVVKTIQELAKSTDVVFLMLSDDNAIRQVVLGNKGVVAAMQKNALLIDMSTISAATSKEVAKISAEYGIQYLRAPVSGSVVNAEAATLTVLASGPRKTYDVILPILEHMSAKQFHVGSEEQARYLKLAINMMVGATAALVGEALALGLKNGLDRETMLEVIGESAVASPLIKYKTETLTSRDYSPAFETVQMAKDFDLILQAARNSNTPMPLAAQVREGWSALIARGDGDQDFFKLVELSLMLAGIDEPVSGELA